MFLYLNLIAHSKQNSFKNRWKYQHKKMEIEKIVLPHGMFYYSVTIYLNKTYIENIDYLKNNIIKPYQIVILKEYSSIAELPFPIFQPKSFPAILFLNSLSNLIHSYKNVLQKSTLAIIDEQGFCKGKIDRFIPYVKNLTIFTKNRKAYSELSHEIFNQYGLLIQIKDILYIKKTEFDFIIDPYQKNPSNTWGIVYSCQENIQYFFENQITFKNGFYLKFIENQRQLAYLSALYEICNLKDLENASYTEIQRIKA